MLETGPQLYRMKSLPESEAQNLHESGVSNRQIVIPQRKNEKSQPSIKIDQVEDDSGESHQIMFMKNKTRVANI